MVAFLGGEDAKMNEFPWQAAMVMKGKVAFTDTETIFVLFHTTTIF